MEYTDALGRTRKCMKKDLKDLKLPLHILVSQALCDDRPWSDLMLVWKNLPFQMTKDALMRTDDRFKRTPLHYAAEKAPRSVIDLMLSLAPDAARVKDSSGSLPLHNAAFF